VRRVAFSADGERLLTVWPDGTEWRWDLPQDDRPVEDLLDLARLLAGTRMDEKRGALPVEPAQLSRTWEVLRARYPDTFTSSASEVLAWRRNIVEEYLRGRQWAAAVWHLDRLIEPSTRDWLPLAQRGLAQAEQGRWKAADADLGRAVARGAPDPAVWCVHALLRLRAGDRAGYRRACAHLLQRAGDRGGPAAYLAAWVCVLAPEAVDDPLRPVHLAERALGGGLRNADYLSVLGAAHCRAGQLEAAVRRLNEAMALREPNPAPAEWLYLAMARRRLGHRVEAQQWLAKATGGLAEAGTARGDADSRLPWPQRLRLELLRKEAERLLKGRAAKANDRAD
jgi:Flp pilus assembly protein TadD